MTLVDEGNQNQLLHVLETKYPLRTQAGGGSAANTLYALSQFGGNAFLTCKVANDDNGDFYLNQLGHHNIETNTSSQRVDGTTGRCIVMVTPDAERTMHTFLGVSEYVSEAELDLEAASDSKYIYLEGYLVTSPSARKAIKSLRELAAEKNVKTAMTFSDPSMVEHFKDEVNELIGDGVDLLFCNENEAKIWSEEDTIEGACAAMEKKAQQFVITRGSQGARLFDGNNYIDVAAPKITAVDTNGAGDMFAGAFLYALTKGESFETAGKLANAAAATVVSNFGPRLPAEAHAEIEKNLA